MSLFLTVYENDHMVNGDYAYGTDRELVVTESFIDSVVSKIKQAYGKVLAIIKKIKDFIVKVITGLFRKIRDFLSKHFNMSKPIEVELLESYIPVTEDYKEYFPTAKTSLYQQNSTSDVGFAGVFKDLEDTNEMIITDQLDRAEDYLNMAKKNLDSIKSKYLGSRPVTQIYTFFNAAQISYCIENMEKMVSSINEEIDRLKEVIEQRTNDDKFKYIFNSVRDLDSELHKEKKLGILKRLNAVYIEFMQAKLAYMQVRLDTVPKNIKVLQAVLSTHKEDENNKNLSKFRYEKRDVKYIEEKV